MPIGGPLKWWGGKAYLASRIVSLMPAHICYVEPYAGGLSVLLARDGENVSEVANDLNGDLVNFWRVLADPVWFADFRRIIEATPFSEHAWQSAARMDQEDCSSSVTRAVAFFVHCRQSRAGAMKCFTGVTKTRVRRGMNNEVSAWLSAIDGLPAVHARLKRVLILNRPALEVIAGQDGPDTLFYLDPPYVHSTRVTTDDYACEMDEGQHALLLEALAKIKGKFLLSGYPSELYSAAQLRHGWSCLEVKIPNHAAGGASKRVMTECLFANYPLPANED